MDKTDHELLREFIDRRDAQAFAQIVQRYIDVVYAAALRQVREPHLAEDVTQAVFIVLARKAASVRAETLGGWLIKTARFTARSALRAQARRKKHEQRAAMSNHSSTLPTDVQANHEQLDAALARLEAKDRTAVTLRFLQGKSLGEVAQMMGVSEEAAGKRVSRAIDKLRSARGGGSTSAALLEQVAARTQVLAPDDLANATVLAALSASTQGAAAVLAQATLRAMSYKPVAIALATTILLALSAVVSVSALSLIGPRKDVSMVEPALAPAPPRVAAAPLPGPRLKVGVILSHYTANGPNWTGKGWGYNSQVRILREIKIPEFELFPLIEPGSENEPDLLAKLNTHFRDRPRLDLTNISHLRQLDVIVANCVNNVHDDALAALETVVSEGKGLFIRSVLGDFEPGFTPQVSRLHGLDDGEYAWNREPVEAEVVGEHPILGALSGQRGFTMSVRANGGFGALTPNAIPLMKLREDQSVRPTGQVPNEWIFFPLYVSQLGSGRVVVCSMAGFTDTPDELQAATGGKFAVRAISWAAGRSIQP